MAPARATSHSEHERQVGRRVDSRLVGGGRVLHVGVPVLLPCLP